ncbi:MAG TPA: tetratricopeptide repeat protein, partial [Candidatus Rifleibacterium sp.]|nr:tetratricopeptide repeat protein [Candidatus Rifleibacterium sp.]
FFKRNIMGKVMPVYHHISKLYIKTERFDDAEKLLNEGIAFLDKENPEESTRLRLLLAEIYKNKKDTKKAEEAYKKIIEESKKNLE